MNGSPLRFFVLQPGGDGDQSVEPGIAYGVSDDGSQEAQTANLRLHGDLGASQTDVQLRLVGLDDAVNQALRTHDAAGADPGVFDQTVAVTRGHRYLLAVGAVVPIDAVLRIGFSEGLDPSFAGIEVRDASGHPLAPVVEPAGSARAVAITPQVPWSAGKVYTLVLGPGLADGSGQAWGKDLAIDFRTEASRRLGSIQLAHVRDVARLGSWLFVAADTQGLAVLDASDPAHLVSVVHKANGDLVTFPFPLGDPARGVAVDPHGRVLVVGGGVNGEGVIRIFDPLALDQTAIDAIAADPTNLNLLSAPFKGISVLSNPLGSGGGDGTPSRVTAVSDDQRDRWAIGVGPAPAGVTVSPEVPPPGGGEYEVTMSGSGWAGDPDHPGRIHPITVHDLTRGRWSRTDTDPAGGYTVTLKVAAGDVVELLRNRRSLAYVATRGIGLQVVDVNAFYNEDPANPGPPSNLVGAYTGVGQNLELCNAPVSDIGGSILDLGALIDPAATAHPLTLVSLIAFRGLALFDSSLADAGDLSPFHQLCLNVEGSAWVSGLAVLEDYPFDLDGDGRYETSEVRDYLLVAHRTEGVLIVDAQDRDHLVLAGQVKLPGEAVALGVDRDHRRLYVAGAGGGIYVVDLDRAPSRDPIDANGDGLDDRVVETIELDDGSGAATASSPILLVPELGVAFAGTSDQGLHSVQVAGPELFAVAAEASAGTGAAWRQVSRLAPFGVPTAAESEAAGSPDLPGAFRILAHLPGGLGATVSLDVASLGPGGERIAGAGDPAAIQDLPPVALEGTDALVLHRLADSPLEDGYQTYLSDEVATLADLRAAHGYGRTVDETAACTRCDAPAGAHEILSGDAVAVRFSAATRSALEPIFGQVRLDAAELEIPSVRWEASPALRQEPTLNPSLGTGDVAPGTLLASGELTQEATDLAVKSRGFDFAFTRTYRSQTVGAGPLGPGWDFGFHRRLRELPDGDVESYDGRGRRETFTRGAGAGAGYTAPAGRFVDLSKTATGWVWIGPHKSQMRFDRFGRLEAIADAVKDSEDTGNEMRFGYDLAGNLATITDTLGRAYTLEYDEAGRLTKLTDFTGREVQYAYDADGRLASVRSPVVAVGEATFPAGLTTTYGYEPLSAGSLAAALASRDDLTSVTDPRRVEWLTATYSDADGDTRADEVTAETWGGDPLSIAYDFANHKATVTDRRAKAWAYEHDAAGHPTQVTDPTGVATTLAYDAEGLLTTRTEPLGRVTQITYDTTGERRSRGNALQVEVTADTRGANGSSGTLITETTYDPATNLPATVTDPRGVVTTYTRNAAGLPTRIEAPEGATTTLDYDDYGQVTRATNPNGHVTEYAYYADGDSKGYLQKETVDPGGLALTTRYEVDPRGNVTAVVDPRGTRHTSTYNELDWLVSDTQAAGALNYKTTYVYDPAGQAIEVREPYDIGTATASTETTYGPLGEVLTVARHIEATGTVATTTYEYDENRNPTKVTDPDGHVTATAYDDRDQPMSRTMGQGSAAAVTESYAYDEEGRLLTRTDGLGREWKSEYDGYGRLAASIDPLGDRTEQLYDDGGHVTETRGKGAGGSLLAKSGATYDLLGRPTARTRYLLDGNGATTAEATSTTDYDPAGNVVLTRDPLGRVSVFAYDGAERLVAQTDAAGNETTYQLDATGQPEAVTLTEVVAGGGSAATTTTHEYDALGRETAAIDPLGNTTRFTLDAAGRARLVTDPEGNTTERVYDSLGRMTSETRPEGIRIDLAYDANGNRTAYTDARGNTTTWDYDALDRVTAVHYPDATTEATVYDAAGNATQVTQPSGTRVSQAYDAAHRMTGRTIALAGGLEGPTTESYAYDGLGRLTQATSGTGAGAVASTRTYDSLSRVTSETTAGKTVGYQLDPAGNVTAMTYPSGVTVTRQVDDLDRLEAIPGVASYGYRGPDRVAQKTVGALSGTTTYDGARRPTRELLSSSASGTVFDEHLAWSPRGLKVGISRPDVGTGLVLAHDGAERLVAAERTITQPASNSTPAVPAGASGFGFEYDAAQNLLARTDREEGVETVTDMPLDGSGRNRPGEVDGTSLVWDAQGNLVQKGDLHLHYDYRNRLTRVTDGSGAEVASYAYDAFNRKVSRTTGGTTETTAWSGWRALERYRDGQLAERRTYGSGLDDVVRLEEDLDGDGTIDHEYTPVYDHTGNLAVLADAATGKPIERYRHTPYGEETILVDSSPPAVEQLRVKDGALGLEISEGVNAKALQDAVTAGQVSLTDTATSTEITLTATQPIQEGREAFRRIILTPASVPAEGTALELRIEPAALVDAFANQPAADYVQTFDWPAGEAVLDDTAAPRVEAIRLVGRKVEIELSEEPDLATVEAAVTAPGQSLTWTLDPDGYTLRSNEALDDPPVTITVGMALTDLAGTTLAAPLSAIAPALTQEASLYLAPDPRETPASTVGNRAGFQGLEKDPATGLVYVRNRWLDPEMGRFVSTDPLGYSDSSSLYSALINSPMNRRDALGLIVNTGPEELDVIRLIVRKLGYTALSRTLVLNHGEVEIEQGKLLDWLQLVKTSRSLWFLFRVVTEPRVIIDLEFAHNEDLAKFSGALTSPVAIRKGELYHFRTQIDPSIIADSRMKLGLGDLSAGSFDTTRLFLMGWEAIPLDVALLHEFGHSLGAFDLNLSDTYRLRGGQGPTDQYAVDREDEYRSVLGLPLRRAHGVPAVVCPAGDWGSDLCMRKMFCVARGDLQTSGQACIEAWTRFKGDKSPPP